MCVSVSVCLVCACISVCLHTYIYTHMHMYIDSYVAKVVIDYFGRDDISAICLTCSLKAF